MAERAPLAQQKCGVLGSQGRPPQSRCPPPAPPVTQAATEPAPGPSPSSLPCEVLCREGPPQLPVPSQQSRARRRAGFSGSSANPRASEGLLGARHLVRSWADTGVGPQPAGWCRLAPTRSQRRLPSLAAKAAGVVGARGGGGLSQTTSGSR